VPSASLEGEQRSFVILPQKGRGERHYGTACWEGTKRLWRNAEESRGKVKKDEISEHWIRTRGPALTCGEGGGGESVGDSGKGGVTWGGGLRTNARAHCQKRNRGATEGEKKRKIVEFERKENFQKYLVMPERSTRRWGDMGQPTTNPTT